MIPGAPYLDDHVTVYDRGVAAEAHAERLRAHAKHAATSMESSPWHSERRLRILVEEVGEVAGALNDADHDGGDARGPLRAELVQVAAMTLAWIAAIDGSPAGPAGASPR